MFVAEPCIIVQIGSAPDVLEVLRPALADRVTRGLPVSPALWALLEDCKTAMRASAADFRGTSVVPDSSTSCGRSTEDVGEEFGVTARRVRQLIKEGRIQARKYKGAWQIDA